MSGLDRFAEFAGKVLTVEDGSPLVLEDFQRSMLTEHFEGVRELLILMPKKLGKSSLLAGRGLYELCTVAFAEIAIVAASRDQAGLILKQARGYIHRSDALRRRLAVVQREIRHAHLGGTMKVLAADSDTLDGWLGTLAWWTSSVAGPPPRTTASYVPALYPVTVSSSESRLPATMREARWESCERRRWRCRPSDAIPPTENTRSRPRRALPCTSGASIPATITPTSS